jgi:hypothetical protein
VAEDKILIYIVNMNFSKIVAFKAIRKLLNMVSVHTEGTWHPSILGEVDFGVSISYSLQLMGKIILRLK